MIGNAGEDKPGREQHTKAREESTATHCKKKIILASSG
jgi:hypothetical protein